MKTMIPMNEQTKDTTINVIHFRDVGCVIGESCQKHNHVIREQIIELNQIQPKPIDTFSVFVDFETIHYFVNEFGDTLMIDPVPQPKSIHTEMKQMTFESDQIRPCDESLLAIGDNRSSFELIGAVKSKPIIEQQHIHADGLCLSMAFVFMVMLATKFLIDSWSDWVDFANDLMDLKKRNA